MTQTQERPAEGDTYLDVNAHFTRMAKGYNDGCEKVNWQGPIAVFAALQAEIEKRQSQISRVLDLGAGTGQLADLFKEHGTGVHITALEYADGMYAELKNNPNVDTALQGDARNLSWSKNDQYDVATCSGVLDFIENTQAFANETSRVVKSGGLIVLTYEPQKSNRPGVKSYKHDTDTLIAQFRRSGTEILDVIEHENAFTNFRTGDPVANNVMVGLVHER